MNSTENSSSNNTTASGSSSINREALIVSSVLLFVFGLAGNGLILYGYACFRQLRSLTNYFVLNLAIADLLLNAGLAAWIIQDIRGDTSEGVLQVLMVNIDVLCFSASMLNMAAVSIDRYCAVTSPLKYKHIITRSRARKATILIWIYSLIMFSIGVCRYFVEEMDDFNKIFVTTLTAISFVIPAFIMIFAHLSIFRVAWITKRDTCDLQELSRGRNNDITKRLKISFNTLVILVPMVTAWGIFYGITVLEAHCLPCYKIPVEFSITVGILPYAAAAIDPIVYILVTRDLRLRLCKWL